MNYVLLDDDGRVVGSGSATNPIDFEMAQKRHGAAFEQVPDNMKIAHGSKYDRKTKKVTAPPDPPKPVELELPPELKKRHDMPSLEEFADAYYLERRGDPKPMEAYLRKRDAVEQKARAQ